MSGIIVITNKCIHTLKKACYEIDSKKKIIEGKIAIIIYIVFLKKLLFNQSSTMFRLQSTLPYGSHSCPIEDMGIDI